MAGSPTRTVSAQAGFIPGGPIPFQRPDPYDTPYYDARRARNAAGQGSPYIQGGQYMTPEQRQAGYAAMAQPQQPSLAAMGGQYFPQQPSQNQMPQAPGPLARMGINNPSRQFSGAGRSPFPGNYLPPMRNREEGLARTNRLGEGGPLSPAVAAAQFGGAVPQVNAQGQPYFAAAPQAPDFAGDAQTAQEAAGRRRMGYQALQDQGVGYYDVNRGAFFGRGPTAGKTFADGSIDGRLQAGGITPSALTQDQLNANRSAYLQRMQQGQQQRMGRVQQLAQARAQERQFNNSPMGQLLQQNPQLAAAIQMQNAQQQHAMNLQALENQGRLGVANAQAAGEAAQMQQRGLFALAANGNEAALGKLGFAAPGAVPAGQVPKYAAGNFSGVDKNTFDYLKGIAGNNDDNYLLGVMGQMGVPANLHDGLLNAVKPNFWRRMNAAAAGANQAAGEGGSTGIPLGGGWHWGPFGPRRN
jgi:hypothetical protein